MLSYVTNHAVLLSYIGRHALITVREFPLQIRITERGVRWIIEEPEDGG
jgi:predicted DNA-binding transcriptional regulator AlpA